MNAQIQIQFPALGEWGKLNMTAVFPSSGGFIESRIYTENSIPTSHAPALEAVVEALVSMDAPWQARQVWARLEQVISTVPQEGHEGLIETMEAVVLTVDAVNERGGRRKFTSANYPDFVLTDTAAVDFFRHFTKQKLHANGKEMK